MEFAEPRIVQFDDCLFYHVMEIPGIGVTRGHWDLRSQLDDFLGRLSFAGKRVLEIGPASGFLSFEMERRGASVVAVEITDDPGWDFVPFPDTVLAPIYAPRREGMRRMKNGFWFAHASLASKVQMHYGDACNLPDDLGQFDIAIMANVLLHCQNPTKIIEQCAKRAKIILIVEPLSPDLEGKPVCRLVPTAENREWGTWWNFSTDFFVQYLSVLGFSQFDQLHHTQIYRPNAYTSEEGLHHQPLPLFSIVASKDAR
jgi:SAM-dependent methyltransferase